MNLIIITSDELRADACAFMGNPDCRTPNLDRLAARGVVFDRHFSPHAKCVPSRVAMMTGRYCHTDGVRAINQECEVPPGVPTLVEPLKAKGYESAFFGHDHVWQDFWGDNTKGSGRTDYHSFTEEHCAPLLERTWPVPTEPGPAEIIGDPLANLYVERRTTPVGFFQDDNRAEQARHYLTELRDRTRPCYLQLNFGAPHPAYRVEEPYFSMYDRQAITPWPHDLPENAPLPLRKQREIRTPNDATTAHFRQVQAVYYGMVTKMDMLLGRVLDTIDAENLWDDTVVLFTADHGDFAGQFGLPEKWDTTMHDCLLHVPAILCAPGLQPRRVDQLTDHTDWLPTLAELLDFPVHWGTHGASMLPTLEGRPSRQAVFADGGHEADMRARFSFGDLIGKDGRMATQGKQQTYHDCPDTMARTKMIRTDRWKLVVREIDDHELYDLAADPHQLRNLWGDPRYAPVVQDLQLQLLQWCLRTDTDRPRCERVGA